MKVLHALDIFYKGVQTPIQMGSILTTSEHQAQLECTECNHCVHLSILHIQMCAKSRSNHTNSWKCCMHSTYFTKVCKHQYKWAVFWQRQSTKRSKNVQSVTIDIQMFANFRSNHTNSWKCCMHSTYFTKVCKHQYKWAVFWQRQSTKRSKNVQSVTIAYIFRFCTFRCAPNPDLIILTHESAACTRHILQRCANTNTNGQYFDNVRAPSAARMYRV